MNQAAIKYTNISAAQEGKFYGSDKTITMDIIIMIADSARRQGTPSQSTLKPHNSETNQTKNKSQANWSEDMSQIKPPLLKHYKPSNDKTGVKYKVGYSNESQGNTCYFCNIPYLFQVK